MGGTERSGHEEGGRFLAGHAAAARAGDGIDRPSRLHPFGRADQRTRSARHDRAAGTHFKAEQGASHHVFDFKPRFSRAGQAGRLVRLFERREDRAGNKREGT